MIVGEDKENKGEKEILLTNQTPPLQLPGTRKNKKSGENFSYAPRIAIVAITTRRTLPYKVNLILLWHSKPLCLKLAAFILYECSMMILMTLGS